MNTPQHDADRLAQQVHATLGKLPPLQAPSTLESRVLRELARREARPWWRQGFGRWPLGARVLFVPLSAGFIKLAFLSTGVFGSAVNSAQHMTALSTVQSRWQALSAAAQSLYSLGTLAMHQVPQVWIYGIIGLGLFLYASLFGIGAAAFRTLIVTPNTAR
jgi:hypothetical protein